jgi:hypothetical protein
MLSLPPFTTMEMITISCQINGQKVPVQFYVGQSTPALCNPIHFQRAWIREERGVPLPANIGEAVRSAMEMSEARKVPVEQTWKLREIADENSVSYLELCNYALPASKPLVE